TDTDTDTDTSDTASTPIVMSIPDIQEGIEQGTVFSGTLVSISGPVITGWGEYGIYVQESAGGPWTGIFVYMGTGNTTGLAIGDVVSIVGEIDEYYGLTEIDSASHTVSKTGTGALPSAEVLTIAEATTYATAEPYESCLVEIQSVTVEDSVTSASEWIVTDGVNEITVGDQLYDSTVSYLDTFTSITGALRYTSKEYKIEPRQASDLAGHTTGNTPADSLSAGDIIITELMVNPAYDSTLADCVDPNSEYLEIYNTTGSSVSLQGLWIMDDNDINSGGGSQLTQVLDLPANSYALGMYNGTNCYGINVDFSFDLQMNNGGDRFRLQNSSGTIDEVDALTGWTFNSGVSLQLDSQNFTSTANDSVGNWCDSIGVIPNGTTDLGTPGQANAACN
ncbi:MAG: hypothetical protein HN348_17420, partial [Proteobacteria bacterium]|nr:hypothetical protein [Pseudomonadota bacterium]